ncbi:NAD(P)H-binding protein [Winogradskyella sp. PG-2]|uniref:NAD(P)H-binding protein n=1 Tax=Winogradskyella sp. PG-2 TaxID=754409 RepID=UPI00045893E8|nr:NAD(P)H-binding protein [Winogradskyella sp. PG-2]BAO75711.1 protein yeeZ precursor [Winogradskyella sp. PG-2]
MKNKISVIGCGWLGFPLAKNLVSKGYDVKGSTTSNDKLDLLKNHKIQGFLVSLDETQISGGYSKFLTESEIVIINIPPGLRRNPHKNHVTEISHLINVIEKHNVKFVLYVSSTSVFKDSPDFPEITCDAQPNASSNNGQQLIKIEQILRKNINFKTTILRFGGLYDNQKHPAKFLSGRTHIKNPNAPINLIHKEDCIQIITAILKNKLWGETFNAVYPYHPDKKTYYSNYCEQLNIPLPSYNMSEKSEGKIINSSKLVQLLNYTFKQTP